MMGWTSADTEAEQLVQLLGPGWWRRARGGRRQTAVLRQVWQSGRPGGNVDNEELRPGTTPYLPMLEEGAGCCAGDGQGVQGGGEVCVTAVETALTGSFRLTVRRDLGHARPFAENATRPIAISLDAAAEQATREMIEHVCPRTLPTRNQAYMLCSLAGDLRVTQTVDSVQGCHTMLGRQFL